MAEFLPPPDDLVDDAPAPPPASQDTSGDAAPAAGLPPPEDLVEDHVAAPAAGGGLPPPDDLVDDSSSQAATPGDGDKFAGTAKKIEPSSGGRVISEQDLKNIADSRPGVTPEFLRRAAGWFGGRAYDEARNLNPFLAIPEAVQAAGERLLLGGGDDEAAPSGGPSELIKYNVGRALGMVAMDLPQNLVRKAAGALGALTPAQEDALVDLQEIIHARRPWSEAATEAVGNVASGSLLGGVGAAGAAAEAAGPVSGVLASAAAGAKAVGKAAATSAGVMAAYGAAGSREGEALHDAVLYGTVGAALGVGGHALIRGVNIAAGARTRAAEYVARGLVEDAGGAAPVAARMAELKAEDATAEAALRRVVHDPETETVSPKAFIESTTDADRRAISELAAREAGETSEKAMEKFAAAENLGLTPQQLLDEEAYEYTKAQRADFGTLLGAKDAKTSSIAEAIQQQDPEFVSRAYDAYRDSTRLRRAASELTIKNGSPGPIFRLASFISDNRAVLSAMDRRFDQGLAAEGDVLAARANAATVSQGQITKSFLDDVAPKLRKMEAKTASGGVFTPEVLGDALNTGDWSELLPRQREAATALKDVQELAARKAESFHTDFPELDISPITIDRRLSGPEQSYLHNTVIDPVQYVVALEDRLRQVGGVDGLLRAADAGGEKSAAGQVKRGLEIWSGGKILSQEELNAAVASLKDISMDGEALQTRAGALLKRTEKIPDFLLQRDPVKAFARWTNSTFRHLATRDSLVRYSTVAKALSPTSPVLSDYLTTLVKDLSGVRRNTLAGGLKSLWTRTQLGLEREAVALDKAGNTTTAHMLRTMGDADKIFTKMTSNMYTYFLGMNLLSVGKNLAQPLATTLPALATSDPLAAGGIMGRAYARAFADVVTRRARKILQEEGLQPSGLTYDANRWFQDGLAAMSQGPISRGLEALGKKSMFGFELADIINRGVARHVAIDLVDTLARDAGAGIMSRTGRAAAEAIASAEPAYRDLVLGQIRRGETDEAKKTLARYLNGSTQYNYSRSSMSEFGRSVGGAFSMFTKWPSVAAGDILSLVDAARAGKPGEAERRVIQGLQKYLAPVALASMAGAAGYQDFIKENPRAKVFLGKDPLSWTAADSAVGLAGYFGMSKHPQSMFPPIAETAIGALGGGDTGDLRGAVDALGEAVLSGLPSAVYLRFLLRDAPGLFMNEEPPEGRSTAEKLHNIVSGPRD